jgi:hypothetical protein
MRTVNSIVDSVSRALTWLVLRGPAILALRCFDQVYRAVFGRPVLRYCQITPHLLVGGQHRRHGWKHMQDVWGIDAVINLRQEVDDRLQDVAPDHYLHVPTRDNYPPDLAELRRAVDQLAIWVVAGHKVYVHCGVGVGRAPTLAAAYLVTTGMTPDVAWSLLRAKRPFILPLPAQRRFVGEFYADWLASRDARPGNAIAEQGALQ